MVLSSGSENQCDWCNLGAGTRSSVIVNIVANSKGDSGNPNSRSGQASMFAVVFPAADVFTG